MKLLIVEDELDLSELIQMQLQKSGYAIDVANDGEEALFMYELNAYDLIILDLNLPKMDGLDVLKTIRQKDDQVKILILSARDSNVQKVEGLDSGSNDYLVKPFDMMELEARIRSLLRLTNTRQALNLSVGNLIMNTATKSVALNDKSLVLTKKEYAILEYLLINQGHVVSAETLVEHIWDSDFDLFSNSLKFHLHSLKQKISKIEDSKVTIRNIRSTGYIIEEDANENIQ